MCEARAESRKMSRRPAARQSNCVIELFLLLGFSVLLQARSWELPAHCLGLFLQRATQQPVVLS